MKIILALLLISSIQYAQGIILDYGHDSLYNFKLPPLIIENYDNNRKNHFNYDSYPVNIKLNSEYLVVEQNSGIDSFYAPYIRTVGIQHGNSTLKASLYFGLGGSVLGLFTGIAFISAIHFEDNLKTLAYFTLSSGLAGALIGAIAGMFTPNFDMYTGLSFENRLKKEQLISIFKKYHKL